MPSTIPSATGSAKLRLCGSVSPSGTEHRQRHHVRDDAGDQDDTRAHHRTNGYSGNPPSDGCKVARTYAGRPVASSPTAVPSPITPPMKRTSAQSTPAIHSVPRQHDAAPDSRITHRDQAHRDRDQNRRHAHVQVALQQSDVSLEAMKRARSGTNHNRIAQRNQPIAQLLDRRHRAEPARVPRDERAVSGRAKASDPSAPAKLKTIRAVARNNTARTEPIDRPLQEGDGHAGRGGDQRDRGRVGAIADRGGDAADVRCPGDPQGVCLDERILMVDVSSA